MIRSQTSSRLAILIAATVALLGAVSWSSVASAATTLNWTFDGGNLSLANSVGGTGTLAYWDAATQAATTYGTTGAFPPNFGDGPSGYLRHPALPNGGKSGYQLSYTNVLPNDGGAYVNEYTMVFDVLIPSLNWTALFNTDPGNGNDADWYVTPSGELGIGALGYSAAGAVSAGQWHRIGFVYDRSANSAKYWVDGANVFSGAAGPLDGRFSLYSSLDAIPAYVNLHGEGDGSGNYTNEIFWNNFLFSDTAFDDATMQSLGGATAGPISVPEPSAALLAIVAAAGGTMFARRRRS